jgi:hypothetical protein
MLKKLSIIIAALLLTGTTGFAQEIQFESISFNSVSDFSEGFSTIIKQVGPAPSLDDNVLGKRADKDTLNVKDFGFKTLVGSIDNGSLSDAAKSSLNQDDGNLQVTRTPLCFPNPFRQEIGTELRYYLNQNGAVDIHIYDMMANLVFKQTMPAGSMGGKSGLNYCKVNSSLLQGYQLSAGVYFVFLLNNGRVLSKVKMAVIP